MNKSIFRNSPEHEPRNSNSGEAGTTASPSSDEVAQLAYYKFIARGCSDGHALEDWLAAEAELQNRDSQHASN